MVKRFVVLIFIFCSQCYMLYSQDHYRINFLTLFDKIPTIKTCDAAYQFVNTKGASYKDFLQVDSLLQQSMNELTLLETAINQTVFSPGKPMMNPEDAKALQEKLKNMTPEERKQWAMQNYQNYMPAQSVHANRDMNNRVVNDAVEYVTKLKGQEYGSMNDPQLQLSEQIQGIEAKYAPQKEQAKKDHYWGDEIGGEGSISPELEKKYAKEHEAYQKTMLVILNEEMSEKLEVLFKSVQNYNARYTIAEQRIDSTHYGDDAKETFNKNQLIFVHNFIARRVRDLRNSFEEVYNTAAGDYSRVYELRPIKNTEP